MSVQTEIDRITQNVADTYSALEEKGATMPAEQNSDNLASTARTVPAGGTSGLSVQADWNQTDETAADFIKNKPFGKALSDSVTFDGDLSGVNAEGIFFKVSDSVPTYADVTKGGAITVNGETAEFTAAEAPEVASEFPDGIILLAEMIFIVPPEMAGITSEDIGLAFPEAGVYFLYSEALVTELRLNDYAGFVTTKKLDMKYYDTQTVFYSFTGDKFIYSDTLGTKTTREELLEAVHKGGIIIRGFIARGVPIDGWYYPLRITYDSTEGDYASAAIEEGSTIKYLYTAEYTES